MSNTVLIIGESGTGKSSSIETLNPAETFIINVLSKPLPFKGANAKYTHVSNDRLTGNMFLTDDHETIMKAIKFINVKRLDIKNLIIDDFSYLMTNEFMKRAVERGYDKYSEMAKQAWEIIMELNNCRSDLNCFVLAHSETDEFGVARCKTIGKVLSNKVILEGMVTCVLHAIVKENVYKFLTQNTGSYLAKSPRGMFEEKFIDNDLNYVSTCITNYFNDDLTTNGDKQ
jgi:hypothetical protein